MSTQVYCRYPDICGDEIVFVADDDIWLARLDGGLAQRLSADHAVCSNPRFSPDGQRVAWTSLVAGYPDVYVFDRRAGTTQRLTWFGSTCLVVGWADDTHVEVASGHQEVFAGLGRLYLVALDGTYEKLPIGPAMGAAWSPTGALAINTPNNRDSSYWKRYRGGTAAALWCHQPGTDLVDGWAEILPDEPAGKYAPGWVGNRLIFTSDLSAGRSLIENPTAQAQLYSVLADGSDLRQHTHHTMRQGYVRDAATDGAKVVYHSRGVLYVLDGLDATPRQLAVDLGVTAPRREDLEAGRLGDVAVDETGSGSLVEWHGGAYFVTHRAGPARALVVEDGVRARLPGVLGEGRGVVVTDAAGEDAVEVVSLDGLVARHRLAAGDLGRVLELAPAPNGASVALASHDGRVQLVDVATGEQRLVGQALDGEAFGLAWSPDSAFLVWVEWVDGEGWNASRLRCVNVTSGEVVTLTSGAFFDSSPTFTRDGKHLAWLSRRNFDPSYSDFGFDLAFAAGTRVFLAPLSAVAPLPFGVSSDGWPVAQPDADETSGHHSKTDSTVAEKTPTAPDFDMDGFEARAVSLPVPAGDYHSLRSVEGGLAWLCSPDRGGELGSTWAGTASEAPADRLERFLFASRKMEVLAAKADSFDVSGDGTQIVVRHGEDMAVVPAARRLDEDDDARVKVDLGRLRRSVDRRAQWRQMFAENGRLMAQHFWRPDMDGVNWDGVLAAYAPVIDQAMVPSDVYDILYECVAELNTGHCYVIPNEADRSPRATGFLGVETTRTGDGFRIAKVLAGDSSDPLAWSPLRAAGVDAHVGDVIVAVDGRPAAGVPDIGALLEGAAGQTVELTLRRDGQADRRVAVVALRSEAALRYHDWVAARAAHVEQTSDGRLGYVHVPDMMSVGWAQLERMLARASQREGVLADMRYNRGGHTSQLVINRLTQKVLGWDMARHYATASSYPVEGLRGPVIVLANQWSGSDGDIVTAAAKLHGLPVVGMRTWGGVIGIDSRYDLVDGTTVTQPRFSSWFEQFGWDIENHGVDPDVEVRLTPGQWLSEDDAQLDVAVKMALQALDEQPAAAPPKGYPPTRFR